MISGAMREVPATGDEARRALVLHDREPVVDLVELTPNHGPFVVRSYAVTSAIPSPAPANRNSLPALTYPATPGAPGTPAPDSSVHGDGVTPTARDPAAGRYLLLSKAKLHALPTSGPAWAYIVETARSEWAGTRHS